MGQTKPNPIQVVEFPTYSFGLKLSNVRCLESSFNERVISANQSVLDIFFLQKLWNIIYVCRRQGLPAVVVYLWVWASFLPSRKQVFHKSNFSTAPLLLFGTPGKSFSWHENHFHLKTGSLDEPVLYWKYKKEKKKAVRYPWLTF